MGQPRLTYLEDEYKKDREYSSQFDGRVREIVGGIFARIAHRHEDEKQATDFVVSARPLSVAARIRRPGFERYADVTIRSGRRSGAKTEFVKIFEEGWADIYFYGRATPANDIASWVVLDLNEVRRTYKINPSIVGPEKHNWDGETSFRSILVGRLPSACVLAEHGFCSPIAPGDPPAVATVTPLITPPKPPAQLGFSFAPARGRR